jgi:hypothetical protein
VRADSSSWQRIAALLNRRAVGCVVRCFSRATLASALLDLSTIFRSAAIEIIAPSAARGSLQTRLSLRSHSLSSSHVASQSPGASWGALRGRGCPYARLETVEGLAATNMLKTQHKSKRFNGLLKTEGGELAVCWLNWQISDG